MFVMESNQKGKSLFGSICHQVEDFFQNVDDFVTKGTVKRVESQVYNVGASVKKLYSDVQDKLPPVVKNVKGLETSGSTKKITVTDDRLVTDQNEFVSVEQHEPHIIKPDIPSGKDDDLSNWNDVDYGFENYVTRDLIPESNNTNYDKIFFEKPVNHNSLMPSMLVPPSISISNEEVSVVHKDFSHDENTRSNISADGWLFENELSPIIKSSDPDEIERNEENRPAMDPLLFSARNACHNASIEDVICCDNFPVEAPKSAEIMFSYFSCDDDEEEDTGFVTSTSASPKNSNVEFICEDFTHKVENMCMDHIDSSDPTSPEASSSAEVISENYPCEVETICGDRTESNEHASTSSIPSCTTLSYETEAMDMLSPVDSNDDDLANSEPVSIVDLCQSRSEHCQEDALSTSETGNSIEFGVDVTDGEMEAIDLSDNEIRDKKNHLLNCNFAHPISHRSRDFMYYKNLVQDVLASRKRLSKEYEHLGIMYGDIDEESRLNFELNSLRSCPKSVNEDWELL